MRRTALLALALGLLIAGCGGGDGGGGSGSDEEDARQAVADFETALLEGDPAAACAKLTPAAQDEAVPLANQVADELGAKPAAAGDCEGALQPTAEQLGQTTAAKQSIEALRDVLESGELEGGEVTANVANSTGTVTVEAEGTKFEMSVEQVDGEWLLSDAAAALFGSRGKPPE